MSWIIPNWIFPPILHSLIFAFFFHFSFLLWIWLCLSAFYRCSKYNRFVISVPNFKGWIFVGISGGSNWLLSCHASSWNCQGKQMTYDMWVAAVSYVITGQKWGESWVEGGGHDLLCSPSIIFTEGVLESDSEAEEGLSPLHPFSILRYEQTRYPLVC